MVHFMGFFSFNCELNSIIVYVEGLYRIKGKMAMHKDIGYVMMSIQLAPK